jgi:hypothetical protein
MNTNYGFVEKLIARSLTRFPLAKSIAKDIYARVVYFKNKRAYRYKTENELKVISLPEEETFFGYYDKSPTSEGGFLLCHASKLRTSGLPSSDKKIDVCLFSSEGDLLLRVPTSAYNWQQGSRTHWLNDDLFIFNDFDMERRTYISRVYSQRLLKEVKIFPFPVQDSYGTEYFISLNYRRLDTLRPDYGYRNLPKMTNSELRENLDKDGLWKVKFSSGEVELVYSLSDILKVDYIEIFEKAIHKVNHVMISPGGDKFVFLHRYFINNRRYDRLMLADAVKGAIKVLVSYEMVSHYSWVGKDKLLVYMRGPHGVDSYYWLDVYTGNIIQIKDALLSRYGDGHPHAAEDFFVTDTYPDKARMQHLILSNIKTEKSIHLGEFFHGFEYKGESRCDLHPRLAHDRRKVFFDSVQDGKRKLCFVELTL